ncbi:conjugal transfer protein TraG N-terminal domain-containing protein [Endozoicomonas gorgoniicola]|uniref:Conjugal transfer protein TraG N-terminal domain-containing protein n=1 Tax=Endozoicomonas gorgoniicola TaxID=1234144 RepID=A0ABT3MUD1_9GAMM|nr:conjugal transfer protein TraG N-terminal domain-containing protein [Endozoicomonas gorgoniicola]MCW7552688.1 conjugal transfer protein TraG N-terminal domain-containing protein [Endozoicomonas gorgoniicola]
MESIYSIGDAHFLYTVLNGLVLMVSNPDFLLTIKIGFIIGTFYLALQGLMAGKFPAFQHLLLSLLIYTALFGLPTGGSRYKGIDVDIYDVYTDTNRKVDNVPFGIALTASMLSTLTWKMTEIFEQAFHTTDAVKLTRNGYLSSLTRLMEARSKAMNQFQNTPALAQSWRNYIKECTLIGIDLNYKTTHEVFSNADVMAALEFQSEVFGTLIYRNGQPTSVTCNEAFAWLKPRLTAWFDQQIQQDNTTSARNLTLSSALQALSQGAESSRNFMMASALLPIYHDATIEKLQDMQQPQAAIMTQQAILQRNTQWAGEQHLFLSSMRAMMAYIEGFVFAVTPLMGLLVCVGLFGVRLAFKYLMLLLWIQLWMPVLAINNLYITLVSQGAMAALSAPITSFTGIIESGPILEYWLGVGGLMAASTPALVLMLLYGSAITATHLAGRMQSGDFVNEKISSPDIMMPGAAVNQQAGWNIGPQQGATRGQIDQVVPALSASSHLSSLVQSKDAARKSSGMAFSQATSHAIQQRYGDSIDSRELRQFSSSLSTGESQVTQMRDDLARDLQKQFGLSSQSAKDMATTKILEAGGGIQKNGLLGSLFGVNGGYQKQWSGGSRAIKTEAFQDAISYLNKESFSKNWSSNLQKALSMDASSSNSHSWVKELGMSDNQSYQKMAQESLSTEKSYEQASQLQQQLGQALNTGPAVWANRLSFSESAMNTLQSKPFDPDFQQQVNHNMQRFSGQFASSSETLAAALVSTYLDSPDEKDLGRLSEALQQSGIISAESLKSSPESNQTLASQKSSDGSLAKSVNEVLHQPESIDSGQVRQHISESSQLPEQKALQDTNLQSSAIQQLPEALQPLARTYSQSSQSISGQFQHSGQSKPYITSLLKHSAYGTAPSTSGPGLKLTYNEAFDRAVSHGLTDHQAAAFASMVKDRDPSYERSADPEDRRHRLGQSIAEISRGWGDHGAVLGQHAFNHLTHAADNPQHTNAALTLIGEMNRLYQPELRQYEQSVGELLKGQSLLPMEGNYLDTTMPPEHIGSNVLDQLNQRQTDNNQRVFGRQDKGLFQEASSRLSRTQRDMSQKLSGLIKPDSGHPP